MKIITNEMIEVARSNETVMGICHAEYSAAYGKSPPDGWMPSDEEVIRVAERCGIFCYDDI